MADCNRKHENVLRLMMMTMMMMMMMMLYTWTGAWAGCPGVNWTDAGNGLCYAVFTQTSPFTDAVDAQSLCRNNHNDSELASLQDGDNETLVLELIRNATVSQHQQRRRRLIPL